MERRVMAPRQSGWRPIFTAFSIWFVHFMVCWAAVEIWPQQWLANVLAWGATAIALAAMGVHFVRVSARDGNGDLARWNRRFAQGATAIATAAVLFSALPSIVFRP
jgi:succinate dehydrogenase hydrophobic anchor subunit